MILVVSCVIVFALAAISQTAAPPASQQRLAAAVRKTLDQGHDAVLPPHISHLLGISPEEKQIPIKQFAEMGQMVRGFDVAVEKNDDIVIFTEDRTKNESTFYLMSRRGAVRKVLSIREGVGYDRLPTTADKKEFETQKGYWLDQLAPRKH